MSAAKRRKTSCSLSSSREALRTGDSPHTVPVQSPLDVFEGQLIRACRSFVTEATVCGLPRVWGDSRGTITGGSLPTGGTASEQQVCLQHII